MSSPEEEDESLEESEHEHDDAEGEDDIPRRRRRIERILPEVIKRAIEKGIETGIGTITNANESIRGMVGQRHEVPKEVASYVLSQIDDTKNAAVGVVAREVREFLERADLAKELQRALTSLSFEIRTEIRFIPNDKGGVTPEVKAAVDPKQTRNRRPSAVPEPNDDET
ncbi:MAG: hypothetical protein K1X94_34655 [Sandaracinaceae bacterium]|nr:hypothetical protein [Sandaracinaceae bacterium]